MGFFDIFKKEQSTDLNKKSDIIKEKIDEIMYQTGEGGLLVSCRHLDEAINKYKECKSLLNELKELDFDGFDELKDEVNENSIAGINNSLNYEWNARFYERKKLENLESKTEHAKKTIQYFEKYIPKIPIEFEESTKEWVVQIKGLVEELKAEELPK